LQQSDPSRPTSFPSPPGTSSSTDRQALPAATRPPPLGSQARQYAARVPAQVEQLLFEVKRLIVGQDRMLERILVALLAGGHVLLEGVPGLAKTATIKAFAQAIGGQAGRIQFTPDLVPADLVGTRIYNPATAEFSTELGPVFCNLLLADEINRAPAKVQSALLEVMQEQQVTIGKETYPVPQPFLVLATQNPIETDGTYPLPEAQIDRFMFKVLVGYPSFPEEVVVVQRVTGAPIEMRKVTTVDRLREMQRSVAEVYVDPAVVTYAATLATATRNPTQMGLAEFASAIAFGASPRASIHMVAAARGLAFIRGRNYVLPMDVADVAPEVLRHRLVLSYEGIAAGVSPERIVACLVERYPPPRMDLGDRVGA
jgi:MoxR-like ATPase